jgi:hypothetical protein
MAKQAGDIFIEGTIDDLTYYKMEGRYYVRMKSSLTRKKFRKHKAFERSRASCKRFSEGNKLASKLYRMIEKNKRIYKLFCFLKKRSIMLLKEGKSLIEVEEILMDYLMEFGLVESIKPILESTNEINPHAKTMRGHYYEITDNLFPNKSEFNCVTIINLFCFGIANDSS